MVEKKKRSCIRKLIKSQVVQNIVPEKDKYITRSNMPILLKGVAISREREREGRVYEYVVKYFLGLIGEYFYLWVRSEGYI